MAIKKNNRKYFNLALIEFSITILLLLVIVVGVFLYFKPISKQVDTGPQPSSETNKNSE